MTVELATRSSYHSASEQLRRGFVTLPGGHRLGLSGTAVTGGGEITGFRQFSSLDLRIARAKGTGSDVLYRLMEGDTFSSTLILSPPGKGKTTLLRELVRQLSDGTPGYRVGLVDERGEVAALVDGVPQLDVGQHTDVMEGGSKAEGLLLMLRSMNPQILASDEITDPADVAALSMAAHCGVALLATAHAVCREELDERPLYRQMLGQKIFSKAVWITEENGRRCYRVEELT
jgi:stage III sporulation protein AA